jgi:MFS family permease
MDNSEKYKTPKGVVVLGWVSFLTDTASEMIYPLLPDFLTRVLGAGPVALGLIEGAAESAASLTKMLSGWWSDRSGRRKPFVVAGYTLAGVVRPLVAIATSWWHVLAIRFTDRVGKGLHHRATP